MTPEIPGLYRTLLDDKILKITFSSNFDEVHLASQVHCQANIGFLKGKVTRKKLSNVVKTTCMNISEGPLEKHGDVTL